MFCGVGIDMEDTKCRLSQNKTRNTMTVCGVRRDWATMLSECLSK